jgi:hypothetical protein
MLVGWEKIFCSFLNCRLQGRSFIAGNFANNFLYNIKFISLLLKIITQVSQPLNGADCDTNWSKTEK